MFIILRGKVGYTDWLQNPSQMNGDKSNTEKPNTTVQTLAPSPSTGSM
jgi:hypothetical protein